MKLFLRALSRQPKQFDLQLRLLFRKLRRPTTFDKWVNVFCEGFGLFYRHIYREKKYHVALTLLYGMTLVLFQNNMVSRFGAKAKTTYSTVCNHLGSAWTVTLGRCPEDIFQAVFSEVVMWFSRLRPRNSTFENAFFVLRGISVKPVLTMRQLAQNCLQFLKTRFDDVSCGQQRRILKKMQWQLVLFERLHTAQDDLYQDWHSQYQRALSLDAVRPLKKRKLTF